jgi:UBX domain-containing protein 6
LGTKAEDEEKKKARIAALEAEAARRRAQAGGGASGGGGAPSRGGLAPSGAAAAAAARLAAGAGGSSADDMRRQILAERERRRAAMLKEKEEREKALAAEDEDPAMAPLNDAVARVAAHADAEASASLLLRIVGNALNNPGEPKYRRVRLANPKIAAAVLETDGGLVLLECSGFRLVFEDDGGEGDPRVMVLDADADPAPLSAAFRRLARLAPAAAAKFLQAAPAVPAPRPPDPAKPPAAGRNARAFTPAEVCAAAVTDLGDEYFQRTPEEIQAEMARKRAQRERDSVLTTKSWKDKNRFGWEGGDGPAGGGFDAGKPAVVRVRMPDGVVLQGDFGRREPAGAVREFVANALREPHRTFSLSFLGKPVTEDDEGGAAAKAAAEREQAKARGGKGAGYAAAGTVEGAGLFPSALVTLKWTDANTDGGKAALAPALMASAEPLE